MRLPLVPCPASPVISWWWLSRPATPWGHMAQACRRAGKPAGWKLLRLLPGQRIALVLAV